MVVAYNKFVRKCDQRFQNCSKILDTYECVYKMVSDKVDEAWGKKETKGIARMSKTTVHSGGKTVQQNSLERSPLLS